MTESSIPYYDKIPAGLYCYTIEGINPETGRILTCNCPYWSKREDKPDQENGYCELLGEGDWQRGGLSLLWDKVKECGYKMDDLDDHQA